MDDKTNKTPSGWPEQFAPFFPDSANNPFASSLAGGIEFMKNFWGGGAPATMPGFVVPTVDLAELEKRIKDLKAVEAWLDVNTNLLRSTIQALEMQHHTIATIQSLNATFSDARDDVNEALAKGFEAAAKASSTSQPTAPAGRSASPTSEVKPGQPSATPAGRHGLPPGWPASIPTVHAAPAKSPAPEGPSGAPPLSQGKRAETAPDRPVSPPPVTEPSAEEPKRRRSGRGTGKLAGKAAGPVSGRPSGQAATSPIAQPPLSPDAWMGFLQDQFNKVARAALMSGSGGGVPSASPAKAPAPKPAAKKIAAKSSRGAQDRSKPKVSAKPAKAARKRVAKKDAAEKDTPETQRPAEAGPASSSSETK